MTYLTSCSAGPSWVQQPVQDAVGDLGRFRLPVDRPHVHLGNDDGLAEPQLLIKGDLPGIAAQQSAFGRDHPGAPAVTLTVKPDALTDGVVEAFGWPTDDPLIESVEGRLPSSDYRPSFNFSRRHGIILPDRWSDVGKRPLPRWSAPLRQPPRSDCARLIWWPMEGSA